MGMELNDILIGGIGGLMGGCGYMDEIYFFGVGFVVCAGEEEE